MTTDLKLADEQRIPNNNFIGREHELRLCRAAFGIEADGRFSKTMTPLSFRLEGPPGVGKNELVYQIARQMKATEEMAFYSIQGHEEMTPEDLSILVVPDPDRAGPMPLQLRASPLATAILKGGLFFFDEINRVPERALSPLASVLDDRRSLYSAVTGITIEPEDDKARARFRFCCALNPMLGKTGKGSLPDYIEERTLPVVVVEPLPLTELLKVIERNVSEDTELLEGFRQWYEAKSRNDISVRQAMALVRWASASREGDQHLLDAFQAAEVNIFPSLQVR